MRVEELMVGDWVNVKERLLDEYEDIPKGICKLSFDDLSEIAKGIMTVEPIPLTSEILEKNDFKKKGTDYLIKGFVYWCPFAKRLFMNGHPCQIDYIDLDECQYVHQLQHFLRNAKIEKEIEII